MHTARCLFNLTRRPMPQCPYSTGPVIVSSRWQQQAGFHDDTSAMPSTPQSVRKLTTRLIARERSSQSSPDTAAAVHAACERVYREIARWVGQNGSRTLFTRALAETQSEHPLLAGFTVSPGSESGLAGLPDSIQTHGSGATAAALESMLLTLLGLLGRLIGDDMVVTLIEPGERNLPTADGHIAVRRKVP